MEKEKEEKSVSWLLIILNILIGAIIILAYNIIFMVDKVYALDLPQPTRMCVDGFINGQSNQTYCGNGRQVTLWNKTFWEGPTNYYQIGGYSQSDIYYSNNIQYDILGYCEGQSILISGEIAGISNLFIDKVVNYTFVMNGHNLQCTFEQENLSLVKYTCSGIGGGNFIINVNVPSYSNNDAYEVAFSKNVNVTCDNNISDLIVANQNNTQNIIDAGNQNTIDIMDTFRDKALDIINNQNSNSQAQIEAIEKQNIKCENLTRNFTKTINSKYLDEYGNESSNNTYDISNYLQIEQNKTYTLNNMIGNSVAYCLYPTNANINPTCERINNRTTITFNSGTNNYIRVTISDSASTIPSITGEYCYNILEGNEDIEDSKQEDTNVTAYEDLDPLEIDTNDLNYMEFTLDTDSNEWVWDRVTEYLNLNSIITNMTITLLAVGLIKLVLSR